MIHYRAVIIDGGEAEFGWQRAQRDPLGAISSEENGRPCRQRVFPLRVMLSMVI